MILSEILSTSKTFSIHSSATKTTPAVPLSFLDHLSLYLVPLSLIVRQLPPRYLVSWMQQISTFLRIVFPLPRKLFLSECSHWVFPPWISSDACLICHNGPTLPPTPDRRPNRRRYQQNFDVCWHRLTLILLLWLPRKILEQLFLRDRLSYSWQKILEQLFLGDRLSYSWRPNSDL